MTDTEKMPPPPTPVFDPPFVKEDMDNNVLRIQGNRYYITHQDWIKTRLSLFKMHSVLKDYKAYQDDLWRCREHLEVTEDDAVIDTLMDKVNLYESRLDLWKRRYNIQKIPDFVQQP